MKPGKRMLTVVFGLCVISCGGGPQGLADVEQTAGSALMLPFPDDYFGMFLAREAGFRAEPPEGCQALTGQVTAAWDGMQQKPEFVQVTDTPPWQKLAPLRDEYAGKGCFTSGKLLSQPSKECAPDFGKLVAAWDALERTPQFTVLISGAVNHDLYASWVNALAKKCVLGT